MKRTLFCLIIFSCALLAFNFSNKNFKKEIAFRDLNKNGKMDLYENPSQPIEARIADLLNQMTVEEKAGLMFINGARVNDDGSIENKPGKGMFAFAPNAVELVSNRPKIKMIHLLGAEK